jgi:AcrR family transcriptional regulator
MRKVPTQIADRLPAAATLFAERGLNDTKIEEVAAATGVPKATLYYYFAGKEDILSFLLEDVLQQVAGEVSTLMRAAGAGADRLHGVIGAQLRIMAQRPDVCRALIGELGRAARIPVIAEKIGSAYFDPVETLLREGAADGSLVSVTDTRAAAVALFGAVTITALTYLIAGEAPDEHVVVTTINSVLFNGLRPRRPVAQ